MNSKPTATDLVRSSRAHSLDRSTNCANTNAHADCNGTDTWTRIAKFQCNGGGGECFEGPFSGWATPATTVAAWICDTWYEIPSFYVPSSLTIRL